MTIKITELQVKTRTKLFNVQFRFLFVTTEVPRGTTVLPLLSRAVLCGSSQDFLPFHSLVDILDLKFGA